MKNFLKIAAVVFLLHGAGHLLLGSRLEFPSDAVHFYSPAAVSLLKGEGYQVNGAFSARYPPLYPLFIAAIYGLTHHAGMDNPFYPWFVILLQSLSCGFLFLIASELFEKRTAVLSALLFGTYPFFAVLSMTRYAWNAMPLFTVLFYAALYFFLRARKSGNAGFDALSGLLLGLSSLAWPAVIYLWPLFGLFALGDRRQSWTAIRIIAVLLFLAGFFLPVLVWSFKVYQHTGRFEVSSGGMLSMQDGLIHRDGFKFKEYEFARDAEKEMSAGGLGSPRSVAAFYGHEFFQKPVATIWYFLFKIFRPWYATDSERHEDRIFLVQIPYLFLGMWGMRAAFQKQRAMAVFLAAIIFYFWLVAFSVLSILRYMIPAMGILMIFAAFMLVGLKKWRREGAASL